LAFIYMAAQISLYAAEMNAVRYRRLWPRGLVQPPLTRADKEAMAALAKKAERISEQDVDVDFEGRPSQETHGDKGSVRSGV
jgi:hypothetical protein